MVVVGEEEWERRAGVAGIRNICSLVGLASLVGWRGERRRQKCKTFGARLVDDSANWTKATPWPKVGEHQFK
jgi:hypothetical protein